MSLSMTAHAVPGPRKDPKVSAALGRRRKRADFIVRAVNGLDAVEIPGGDDLLVPGDPEASLLFRKLADRSPPVGAQMPLDRPPVERRGLALLRAWIEQGARNR